MSRIRPYFISGDPEPAPDLPNPKPSPDEAEALDAYSRVIVHVAEALRPAVVNLQSGRGRDGGSGSGVLFTPDGLFLTNAHFVGRTKRARNRIHDSRGVEGRVYLTPP